MGRWQIGTFAAEQLETICAEPLSVRFRCEIFDQAWESADAVHTEHPAAGYVDVAGQRRQHGECADGLDAFRRVLDRAAPFQHGRLGAREQARRRPDLLGCDPGDRCRPFRRKATHVLAQRIEAVGPPLDERRIVELLADDDVEEGERQRIIGSRTELQPHLGAAREFSLARIDDDDFWVRIERLAHVEAGLAVGAGIERIVAPEQHTGGRRSAGEIGDGKVAKGENAGVDSWMKALRKARLAPVRRAERMTKPRYPADVMAAGAGAERDGFGPKFLADRE